MDRMFESEFDKFIYGEEFTSYNKRFNDRLEIIEWKYEEYFKEKSIDKHFSFDFTTDKNRPAIEFNDDPVLPDYVVEEIVNAFRIVFGGQEDQH